MRNSLIPDIQTIIIFFLGGHEHTPFHIDHSGTTIIKCGQNMDYLGILDLEFEKNEENKIECKQIFNLIPTNEVCLICIVVVFEYASS
jgi:2',3'-cyclic-nucleotide 2'-phosphodiesterase (5'-nucleotidase family)